MRSLLILLVGSSFFCLGSFGQSLDFEYVKDNGVHDPNGGIRLEGAIQVSDEITKPYSIDVTARGNGTLECGGVSFRIFDNYYDGLTYLLSVDFEDLDNDGYKDMTIYGSASYSTEKDRTAVADEIKNILYLYRYDSLKSCFVLHYKTPAMRDEGVPSWFDFIEERKKTLLRGAEGGSGSESSNP